MRHHHWLGNFWLVLCNRFCILDCTPATLITMETTPATLTFTSETLYGREQIRVALAQATSDFYENLRESRKGNDDIDVIGDARFLKRMVADAEAGRITVDAEWMDFAEQMEVSYAEYRPRTIAEAIERANEAHHRWTWRDEYAQPVA